MKRHYASTIVKQGHYMSAMPFFSGARYIRCTVPGCGRVRRNDLIWPPMKPLIHKGKRYRCR